MDLSALRVPITADTAGLNTGFATAKTQITSFSSSAASGLAAAEASLARVNAAANENSFGALERGISLSNVQMLELGHSARSVFDILASGGSPLRALELEGTRLAQVMAMGEGGIGGAIEGIAGAAAALFTPLNLAIAAVGALAIGGVLWLTQEKSATVDATAALEAHKKWLDQILEGYDSTKKAADDYLDSANKLPEAAVASDVSAQRGPALANLKTALGQLQQYRDELNTDLAEGVEEFGSEGAAQSVADLIATVDKAGLSASSTRAQFDELVVTLTDIKNSGPPIEAYVAGNLLDLVTNAEKAATAVSSIDTVLNAMPNSVTVQIDVQMKSFDDARQKLLSLVPDTRDEFTRARDNAKVAYNQELGAAPDAIMRQAAGLDYSNTLAAIDKAQQQAQAQKTGNRAISAAAQQQKKIDEVTASLNRQATALTETGKQQAEQNALAKAGITINNKAAAGIISAADALYDQQQAIAKANAEYSAAKGVFMDFFDTQRQDMEQGEGFWQSWADAGIKAVQDLLAKVEDAALSSAFQELWYGNSTQTSGAPTGGLGAALGGAIGSLLHLAGGGNVVGPGSSTSDSVPAMLSDGEYVVNAASAARYRPMLEAMNAGTNAAAAGGEDGPEYFGDVHDRCLPLPH